MAGKVAKKARGAAAGGRGRGRARGRSGAAHNDMAAAAAVLVPGPSGSVAPAPAPVLPWTGKLAFEFLSADLTMEPADMVVMACTTEFESPIASSIAAKIGEHVWTDARTRAHVNIGKRKLRGGEILVVQLPGHPAVAIPARFVVLAVQPDRSAIRMAFQAIVTEAKKYGVATIAMPALGCGQTGVDPKLAAAKFADVLTNQSDYGSIQKIKLVDRNAASLVPFQQALASGVSAVPASAAFLPGEADPDIVLPDMNDPNYASAFARKYTDPALNPADDICAVCQESLRTEICVQLRKCGHQMHNDCFISFVQNTHPRNCWVCKQFFALPMGNMPRGTMSHDIVNQQVPGFNDTNQAIVINYHVNGGTQGPNHLRPGVRFSGTSRTAYLPNNAQGQKVLRLLQKAFECRLTFTVGDSVTSGAQNTVVWNNIHHKTSLGGGSSSFGYPDPTYLDRVTEELASVGVTEDIL